MVNLKRYSEKVSRKDDEKKPGLQIPSGSYNMMDNLSIIKPLFDPHFKSIHSSEGKIHAKLEISQPGDPSEMQADELAESFMDGDAEHSFEIISDHVPDISPKGEGGEMQTSAGFDQQLQNTKGQGRQIDDGIRGELEQHTGKDLSGVNIHTGSQASEMSESINAKAFAHGQDIYFKEGNYDTQSEQGRSLLAHEVAHTVQAGDGVQAKIQRDPLLESKQLVSKYFSGDQEALRILHGEVTLNYGAKQGVNDINNLIEKIKKAVLLFDLAFKHDIHLGTGIYDFGTALSILKMRIGDMTPIDEDPLRFDYYSWLTQDQLKLDSKGMEQLDFKMFEKEIISTMIYPTLPKRKKTPDNTPTYSRITVLVNLKPQPADLYEQTQGKGKRLATIPENGQIELYDEYYAAQKKDWVYVGYLAEKGYIKSSALDFNKFKWWYNTTTPVTIYAQEFEARSSESSFFLSYANGEVTLNGDPFRVSVFLDDVSASEDAGMSDIEERTKQFLTVRFEYIGSGFADKRYLYLDLNPSDYGLGDGVFAPALSYKGEISGGTGGITISIKPKYQVQDAPQQGWGGATIWLTQQMESDAQWSPPAHKHSFSKNNFLSTGEALGSITVVQPWSVRSGSRKNQVEDDTAAADALLTGGEAMALSLVTINSIITPLVALSPDDPFAGKVLSGIVNFWTIRKTQLEDDQKKDNLTSKPYKNATTHFRVLARLKSLLESLLPALYPADDKTPGALRQNALTVRTEAETAAYLSYTDPDTGEQQMDDAMQKFEFVVNQMQGLQLQKGGGMYRSINQLTQTFNYINRAPGSNYFPGVNALVRENLREQGAVYKHQRHRFFRSNDTEADAYSDPGYPTITGTHLNFLVTLLSVEYSLDSFKKLEADVADNWFFGSTPEAKTMADRHPDFTNLLNEVEKSIAKPEFTIDADLARHYDTFKKLFYENGSFTKAYAAFNSALETLSKTLQDNDSNNEFVKGLIINVVIFIVAEIATLGMATVFAPEFFSLAAFTTFRIVSTTLISTMLSQAVQVMRFGETQVSFGEELLSNALMIGVMRYVGLKFQPWMPKTVGGQILKWGTQEITTLGAMQAFANAYEMVKTGRLMSGDEQIKTLISNSFLHYSGKLTNRVFQKPIENIYGDIGRNIVAANESQFKTILAGLAQTRLELAEITRNMTESNSVDKAYALKMNDHFDYMQQFRQKMLELAGKNDIKTIRSLSEAFDAEFTQFLTEQNLLMKQQHLIGDIGFGAGELQIMATGEENVFLFNASDKQKLIDHYKKLGGSFELENQDNKTIYLAKLNGREIRYISKKNLPNYGEAYRQEFYANELMTRLTSEKFFEREDVQKLLKSGGKKDDVVKDIKALLAVEEAVKNVGMMPEYQDLVLLKDVQLVKLLGKGVTRDEYLEKNPNFDKNKIRTGVEPDQSIAVYESLADFDIAGFTKDMDWRLIVEVKSGKNDTHTDASVQMEKAYEKLNTDYLANTEKDTRIVQLRTGTHEITQDLTNKTTIKDYAGMNKKTMGPHNKGYDLNLRMDAKNLDKTAENIYNNKQAYIK